MNYTKKTRNIFATIIVLASFLTIFFNAHQAEAANPYIQNVFFGQDGNGDYISFDWLGVPEQTDSCTRDIVAVWFNRFNPDGTTEGIRVSPSPYTGDFTSINNGGGSYSNFGNYAFASGFTKYDFCGTNDPDLSKELPQHIKTYINPKLSPERLSFVGQDFITIQIVRLHLNVVNVFGELLTSDPQAYYYQVPTNPIPVIPYANVRFGFDENDLLKISFDWVGPSRDTGLLAGFNGSISYPFYSRFDPDPSKDMSIVLEDGHNENFGNVEWLGGPPRVEKGQHYEIPVNELHEWSPINTLRVCNWYYPCPVSRSLTESLLGRSFKPDDYITLAFYSTNPSQPSSTSYVLNDPNKYYFVATTTVTNKPPTLSYSQAPGYASDTESPGVDPNKGTAEKTSFTFRMVYTDADNDPPVETKLIFEKFENGGFTPYREYDLFAEDPQDTNYIDGKEYFVSIFLPKGKFRYYFRAGQSGGPAFIFPPAGDVKFVTAGYSNVAFLPGIMGSRLFEQSSVCSSFNNERWVSMFDCDHERLALDSLGKSIYPLYTKEGAAGAIDAAYGFNIYQSFMGDLERWKNTDHIIADYAIIPYDWRISLQDILQNGATSTGGVLSYGTNQGFPSAYIYQKLHALQESSDTGKITIIAHSNGGLVTKAFIQKLKDDNDPLADKIDDVIFVAVPQSGTPDAIGGLLHGTKLGYGLVMSAQRARNLLHNMPVGYNLLPSPAFINSSSEPLIEFAGDAVSPAVLDRYGNNIDTYAELTDYLLGGDGRATSTDDNLNSPAIVNGTLLASSTEIHQILDQWTPKASTTIYEIAGWGLYTPAGLRYTKNKECIQDKPSARRTPLIRCAGYRDGVKIEDRLTFNGDATVMEKSVHFMPASTATRRYWVNLQDYNKPLTTIDRQHRDVFEVNPLRPFIKSLITKNIATQPFITDDQSTLVPTGAYVKYEIHSPLNLNVYDSLGNHTGISTTTGLLEEGINGSAYFELGENKIVIVPTDTAHTLNLDAYASGSFTLDIQTLAGDTVTASTTFEAIPTATTTKATLEWNPQIGIASSTILKIDFNADNIIDASLSPIVNGTVVYDITPPEAVFTFSTTTNDVVITGIDAGGEPVTQTTATSTTITDRAGNSLVVPFIKLKEKPEKLSVVFDTLIYNGVATMTPKTTLEYKWGLKNDGTLKELKQDIRIKHTRRVSADYQSKENETKIIDKAKEDGGKSVTKSTRLGIMVLTTSTQDGAVEVQY